MRYRRNMDANLRDLERQALQGDPDAKEQLLRAMERAGAIPTIESDSEVPQLDRYLARIEVRHWPYYLGLIIQLQAHQIPFELRPNYHTCYCENQEDHLLHPHLSCSFCLTDSMRIVPGKISPPVPNHGKVGGYPMVACGNVKCIRQASVDAWLKQGATLEEALEHFPEEKELSVGACDGFPWRAYEEALGGLCDDCMSRYPLSYHGRACQCVRCGEGVGPTIIVPSRILLTKQLQEMIHSYQNTYGDQRTLQIPFVINEDKSYSEAWWTGPPLPSDIRLDQHSMCLIEIRPNDQYRLRLARHQNEKRLLPRFLDILNQRRLDQQLPSHALAAKLFEYHMVGRDFGLDELIKHLVRNMPEVDSAFLPNYHL